MVWGSEPVIWPVHLSNQRYGGLSMVTPPEITMGIIFRAAVPFLFLQAVGLALVVIFPEIILWLPRLVYGN